jgi:hypothetical protein
MHMHAPVSLEIDQAERSPSSSKRRRLLAAFLLVACLGFWISSIFLPDWLIFERGTNGPRDPSCPAPTHQDEGPFYYDKDGVRQTQAVNPFVLPLIGAVLCLVGAFARLVRGETDPSESWTQLSQTLCCSLGCALVFLLV